MCERVMLTPLTPEERAFAEENHDALEWCMRIQRLDEDMYDVAAFGYLQAVKEWFARPDVRKWSFKTVVNQAVRGSVGNERKRQSRQIQTISLDDVIPGTDGLTYGDTVTDENIRYLTGGKEQMALKITYDANIPQAAKVSQATSVEVEKLLEFLGSSHYAMCYEYEDPKEADKKSKALRGWKKYQKRNDFEINKRGEMIFIKKINAKTKRGEKQ